MMTGNLPSIGMHTGAPAAVTAASQALTDLFAQAGPGIIPEGIGYPQLWSQYAQARFAGQTPTLSITQIENLMRQTGHVVDRAQIADMIRKINAVLAENQMPGPAAVMAQVGGTVAPAAQLFEHFYGSAHELDRMGVLVQRSLTDPIKQARRDMVLELRAMRADVGNIIQGIPQDIAALNFDKLLANALAISEAQDEISRVLQTAGALGLDAFVTALTNLSPEQQLAIARMGLSVSQLYALNAGLGGINPTPVTGHYDYGTGTWVVGRQSGGPVSPGMPYVVGEAGPELFVPKTAGTVMPHLAAGGIVVNVGTAIGDDVSIERMLTTAMRRVKLRGGI
jgi:hypothetical protein